MLHSASNSKADILNAQFKLAYTEEDLTNLPDVGRNTIPKLPEIRVMEKGVLKLLQNLKVHKAAGPDTISPRLLNSLASVIAQAITRIFQTSLDEGTVPKDWRKANIVPIFKKVTSLNQQITDRFHLQQYAIKFLSILSTVTSRSIFHKTNYYRTTKMDLEPVDLVKPNS
jgi:hypothetical protein